MSAPTPKVSAALGYTWKTAEASIAWTDITAYVLQARGVSVNRGRASELDDYRAGTADFTLDNSTRRFDPLHSTGAYFGSLVPGVPVKIEGTANGTVYPVFRGFVDGWPQDYDASNKLGVVNVRATDGFGKLAQAGLPSSVYAVEVDTDNPDVWYRLTETSGSLMADSSGNRRDGTFTPTTTSLSGRHPNEYETAQAINFDSECLGHTDQVVVSAFPLTIEAIVQVSADAGSTQHDIIRQTAGADIVAMYVEKGVDWVHVTGKIGATTTAERTATDSIDGSPHHLAAVFDAAGSVTVYIDGTASSTTSSSAVSIGTRGVNIASAGAGAIGTKGFLSSSFQWHGPLADVALYSDDLSAARILAHADAFTAPWDGDATGTRIGRLLDAVGWPSGLRDLATGLTTMGPAVLGANALTLMKRVEASEQGRLFIDRSGKVAFRDRYYHQTVTAGSTVQATFSDDGSDIPYSSLGYDDGGAFIYNRIRASRSGGAEIEVSDSTSITTYGERVDTSLVGVDFATDSQARSAAEYRLAKYKDSQLRVRPIEIKLHGRTAAQQQTVLGLELGYRVNIERTPQGVGTAIDRDHTIEGITHRIGNGAWTTTLTLSPADTIDHAIWGTDVWGTGLWGY